MWRFWRRFRRGDVLEDELPFDLDQSSGNTNFHEFSCFCVLHNHFIWDLGVLADVINLWFHFSSRIKDIDFCNVFATCHVLQQDMEVVQVDLKARRATVSVKELTCQPSMYPSFCLWSVSCLQDVEQALQGSRVPLEEATKGRFQTHETFISDGRYDIVHLVRSFKKETMWMVWWIRRISSLGIWIGMVGMAPYPAAKSYPWDSSPMMTSLRYGIFVNIGAHNCHGRLSVPRFLGNQLIRGQARMSAKVVNPVWDWFWFVALVARFCEIFVLPLWMWRTSGLGCHQFVEGTAGIWGVKICEVRLIIDDLESAISARSLSTSQFSRAGWWSPSFGTHDWKTYEKIMMIIDCYFRCHR